MNTQVDWLTIELDWPGLPHLHGDRVICISPDGDVEWETVKPLMLEGSFESRCAIKHIGDDLVTLSGNPTKFLQGHNVFGDAPARALVEEWVSKIQGIVGGSPGWIDTAQVTRIDLCRNYNLGSQRKALEFVDLVSRQASLKFRSGRANIQKPGTVMWTSKGSYSFKFYAKGPEVDAHKLPQELPKRNELREFASPMVRGEFSFKRRDIANLELTDLAQWTPSAVEQVYNQFLDRIQMGNGMTFDEAQDILPPKLIGPYKLWLAGERLQSIYPRRTFYRYRSEILRLTGFDVGLVRAPEKASNVVPLIRVLEATPVTQAPDWMIEAGLVFRSSAS